MSLNNIKIGDVLTLQFDVVVVNKEQDKVIVEGVEDNIKGRFSLSPNDEKYIFEVNGVRTYYDPGTDIQDTPTE